MMTYMMPLMFFFLMYNAPSGLLVYWSVRSMLSTAQQLFRNYKRRKEAESGGDDTGPVRRKK